MSDEVLGGLIALVIVVIAGAVLAVGTGVFVALAVASGQWALDTLGAGGPWLEALA